VDVGYVVLWEGLALPACAACAKVKLKTCTSRDVTRRNIVVNEFTEELDGTVLELAFQDLSPAMQAALTKLKAGKLRLRWGQLACFACA
jgi:hypothetical protein